MSNLTDIKDVKRRNAWMAMVAAALTRGMQFSVHRTAAEKRAVKAMRYEPCRCGSGKKTKFCCGK